MRGQFTTPENTSHPKIATVPIPATRAGNGAMAQLVACVLGNQVSGITLGEVVASKSKQRQYIDKFAKNIRVKLKNIVTDLTAGYHIQLWPA